VRPRTADAATTQLSGAPSVPDLEAANIQDITVATDAVPPPNTRTLQRRQRTTGRRTAATTEPASCGNGARVAQRSPSMGGRGGATTQLIETARRPFHSRRCFLERSSRPIMRHPDSPEPLRLGVSDNEIRLPTCRSEEAGERSDPAPERGMSRRATRRRRRSGNSQLCGGSCCRLSCHFVRDRPHVGPNFKPGETLSMIETPSEPQQLGLHREDDTRYGKARRLLRACLRVVVRARHDLTSENPSPDRRPRRAQQRRRCHSVEMSDQ
jgi:hypothetical protein